MPDVRVRLVFADEVGRHVLRRRGFSACWYLVPADAKLVGDLAHALLREFELRARCPKGLELRLEELPLLATQSIRLVRDDDTIVVRCPPLEDAASDSENAPSSSESEQELTFKRTQRKRKLKLKKQKQSVEQPEKRTKRSRDAPKEAKERLGKPHENRAAKDTAVSKKSSPVESSGSSSSSSSSSENERSSESSSSSSSESEEDVGQRDQKHATRAASVRTQRARQKETASAGKAASNGIGSRTNAPETATKEPRRRRRRLRQRNGRRQRNGEVVAETSANQTLPFSNSNGTLQKQEGIPEQSNETSGTRIGSNNAGLRGYPRAKAHVLFDEVTGDQVEVQHNDRMSNENRTIRRPGEPELAKYGPSYPGSQQSLRSNQVRSSASLNVLNGEEDNSTSAPKRKGKGKYEEKWKRPYEIVATVLDGNAEKSNTSAEGLTTALNSYPAATAGSCGFMPADILAFKTLTLCLETWQPVVSDWQCGQVQSVDASGNSIELLKWTLETNGDSVNFLEGPSREQCSIQISEISELRFLSGPSYATLQQ